MRSYSGWERVEMDPQTIRLIQQVVDSYDDNRAREQEQDENAQENDDAEEENNQDEDS